MEIKEKSLTLKRILIAGGTVLAAVAALFSLRFVSFDNDISVMLPRDQEITRTFQFFRESPLSSTVFVTFEIKEGSRQDLLRAVDQFAAAVNSPLIYRVTTGMENPMEDLREFSRLAPQLTEEADFKDLEAKLTPEVIAGKLKAIYRLSLSPAASLTLPLALQDPLGLHEKKWEAFRRLLENPDQNVQLVDGHLLSLDERRALAVIETKVPLTDGEGGRQLMAHLEGLRAQLPANVSAEFVSGHLHSLSNERTIKRDILITTSVTAGVFLLLFIFLFKDARALLLFITPSISVLISIPICALMVGKLSYIILGMGAVISGIAVDYCIHVYIAMQSGQGRNAAVKEIAKPVISGALTTAGAFAVFLFSGVPGYQQLAVFTIVSTVLSLGLALLIFPYFLEASAKGAAHKNFLKNISPASDRPVMALWTLLAVVFAAAIPFVSFRMDIKQYDGSRPEVLRAEENFHKIWGGNQKPALFTVEGKTFEEALEAGRRIQPEVVSALGKVPYTALPQVWLPEKERAANLKRWNRYWDDARIQKLRDLFKSQGAVYQFSDSAFEPFFKTLRLEPFETQSFDRVGLLQQVKRRFAFETPRGWTLISYFPDEDASVQAVQNLAGKESVISSRRFESLLSEKTLKEAFYLSIAIAAILPALSFLFLRNLRQVLISLIPVLSSLLCIFAVLAVFKMNLNVASLIALMVVGGFSIDYGTFMIHQHEHDLKTNTYLGVTLSALTAFCGAGALLFAQHPVLFTYGAAMVSGVAAGYLSAVFVVPAAYRLTKPEKVSAVYLKAA